MAFEGKEKSVKCDQKVNITAAFGAEMVLAGATSIPNALLKGYAKIGVSDFQMILLIQLIRLISEEKELYPPPEMFADYMGAEPERIRRELADLVDKEIIAVSKYFDPIRKKAFSGYDLEPLFLRLSDLWAGNKAREIEEAERLLRITADELDFDDRVFDDGVDRIIEMFENEFGKLLTPIEIEQIEKWVAERGAPLVAEALKAAVLRDKRNFQYIRTILKDWQQNNVATSEGVAEFEQQFHNRKSSIRSRSGNRKGVAAESGANKAENDRAARKKAYIRSLYV